MSFQFLKEEFRVLLRSFTHKRRSFDDHVPKTYQNSDVFVSDDLSNPYNSIRLNLIFRELSFGIKFIIVSVWIYSSTPLK